MKTVWTRSAPTRRATRAGYNPRMTDAYQIDIPPSFFAVYTDARRRLAEPIGVVRARYEICEDLANHLVGHAQLQHHTEVPVEREILRRIHAGLATPDAGVSAPEAAWIVQRLAELLDWPCPPLDAPAPSFPASPVSPESAP